MTEVVPPISTYLTVSELSLYLKDKYWQDEFKNMIQKHWVAQSIK